MSWVQLAFLLEVVHVEENLAYQEPTGNMKQIMLLKRDPESVMKSTMWIPVRLTEKQNNTRRILQTNPFM